MPRVLHIEGNPGDARLVQAWLGETRASGWGLPRFDLEWVDCLAAGLAHLERRGGRIWAESQPGEGVSFYFTLQDRREGSETA